LFATPAALAVNPRLARAPRAEEPLALIHPRGYLEKMDQLSGANLPLRTVLSALPRAVGRALRRRVTRA